MAVVVFTLMTMCLAGSHGLLPQPNIKRRYTTYCSPGKRSRFKILSTVSKECLSLLYHYEVKNIIR